MSDLIAFMSDPKRTQYPIFC